MSSIFQHLSKSLFCLLFHSTTCNCGTGDIIHKFEAMVLQFRVSCLYSYLRINHDLFSGPILASPFCSIDLSILPQQAMMEDLSLIIRLCGTIHKDTAMLPILIGKFHINRFHEKLSDGIDHRHEVVKHGRRRGVSDNIITRTEYYLLMTVRQSLTFKVTIFGHGLIH